MLSFSQVFGPTKTFIIIVVVIFCLLGVLFLTAYWSLWLLDYSKRWHSPRLLRVKQCPLPRPQETWRKPPFPSLPRAQGWGGLATSPLEARETIIVTM